MPEVRQRDILPLPLLSGSCGCFGRTTALSHCQQHVCRRQAVDERTNDVVCAANSLYASLGAQCEGPASEAQSAVLTDMRAVVADTGTPPPLHEQEAFRELLHQKPDNTMMLPWVQDHLPPLGVQRFPCPPMRRGLRQ